MMHRLLWLVLALVSVADAEDSPQPFTITCDPDHCTSKPLDLDHWPANIKVKVVGAEGDWTCHVKFGPIERECDDQSPAPSGSAKPVLVLSSKSEKSKFVEISIRDTPYQNQSPPGFAAFAPLASAILASVLALLVLYFAAAAVTAWRKKAIDLDAGIRGMETGIAEIVGTLKFPPLAAAPPGRLVPPPPDYNADPLTAEIGKFVQYATDCFRSLGVSPTDANDRIMQLQTLASQIGRQVDPDSARARYRALANTVIRLAFSAVDDDFNKNRTRNETAEMALESLLSMTGFSVLVPKPLEKYNPACHEISFLRSETPRSPGQKGFVARVERRGLLDSNQEVVEKATVVLYG